MKFKAVAALALAAIFLPSCTFLRLIGIGESEAAEMSDAQIDTLLRNWGGREVKGKGWDIAGYIIHPLMGPGGISITGLRKLDCRKYRWAQAVRESLDGTTVTDPTVLGDTPERRARKAKITVDGWSMDPRSNSDGLSFPDDQVYHDEPHISSDQLRNNTLRPGARIYRRETEVCRRCVDPKSDFNQCFTWYYVHIRKGRGVDRSFVITGGTPATEPSAEFKEAIKL
jgi:hypothetical protein